MLSLVTCTENSLGTIAVDLVFFNESLLLKVRFGDAFIGILLDRKLSSDGNQIGEVRIEGWGSLVLSPRGWLGMKARAD